MKKIISLFLMCSLVLSLVVCNNSSSEEIVTETTSSIKYYANGGGNMIHTIMHDGEPYFCTNHRILIDESKIKDRCTITSVVESTTGPIRNGEANFDVLNEEYLVYRDCLVMNIDGEWITFRKMGD